MHFRSYDLTDDSCDLIFVYLFYIFCLSWFSIALLKCVIVYFLECRTMLLLSQLSSLIFSLHAQPLEFEFFGQTTIKHKRTSPTIPYMCVRNVSNLYALWFLISCERWSKIIHYNLANMRVSIFWFSCNWSNGYLVIR